MRRVRNEVRGQFTELMREADRDGTKRELDALERSSHTDIAINPKTATRGQLPGAAEAQVAAGPAEETYTSAEMRDYLSATPDGPPSPGFPGRRNRRDEWRTTMKMGNRVWRSSTKSAGLRAVVT